MVRARRLLARLPVTGRAIRTVDQLRAQRDQLRDERDRLRAQLQDVLDRDAPPVEVAGAGPVPAREVLAQPSLVARTESLRRVRTRSRELWGRADPVWRYNDKEAGARLATELGLRVPRQLGPPTLLEELRPPPVERCLLKPVSGTASRGVTPLVRQADGRWLNLFELGAGPQPWEAIRDELAQLRVEGRISRRFLVEELLVGPSPTELPFDYKCLCVGGEVQLVYARDVRNERFPRHSRYRYFSPTWEDLGPISTPAQLDASIPPPRHAEELLAAAAAVAGALPTPFVRVDLYDQPDDVVFGEITPQPGTNLWFGPELDRRLGEAWDDAEARSWRPADVDDTGEPTGAG
jgi:hypothetical protein